MDQDVGSRSIEHLLAGYSVQTKFSLHARDPVVDATPAVRSWLSEVEKLVAQEMRDNPRIFMMGEFPE